MDLLSDILASLRLRAHVFSHGCYRGEWVLDTSGSKRATFHLLAGGRCWLHLPGQSDPIPVNGGDLIVFPHDAPHSLTNSVEPPNPETPRNLPPNMEAPGGSATILCGYFHFERQAWNPLMESLPEAVILSSEESSSLPLTEALVKFMQYEADTGALGTDLVLDKLSEVLFIHVVRRFVQNHPGQGYIAALADKYIGKALSAFHKTPDNKWSLETLAKAAGLSRSAFTEKFTQLTGHTPMNYVTRWRMTIAHDLLAIEKNGVLEVAEQCGYQSEAAFAKVFKKHFGYGPGAARKY